MVNEIVSMAIGFFCGIIGSIIVYEYQQVRLTKNERKRLNREYKINLLSNLTEISEVFDREFFCTESINYDDFKRELYILSKEITRLISNPPEELDQTSYNELKMVSIKVKELSNHFFALGDTEDEFKQQCLPVMDLVREKAIPQINKKLFSSE